MRRDARARFLRVAAVLVVGIGVSAAMWRAVDGLDAGSEIPVVPSTETGAPTESRPRILRVRTRCGVARLATRDYAPDARAIVGRTFEVLLRPEEGTVRRIIVTDPTDSNMSARLRVTRAHGPGHLWFASDDGRSREFFLSEGTRRLEELWPPSWSVPTTVTGPGCWLLRIQGEEMTDRLPMEVTPDDWNRYWRAP